MFVTYATHPDLGSPGKVYDLLTIAGQNYPLEGNAGGSYLTFRSTNGLVFVSEPVGATLYLFTNMLSAGNHRHNKRHHDRFHGSGKRTVQIYVLKSNTTECRHTGNERQGLPYHPRRLDADLPCARRWPARPRHLCLGTSGEGNHAPIRLLRPNLFISVHSAAFLPVPWAFSTAAALALVALSIRPENPGNVAPDAAVALLGPSGATLLLVVLFLAVTSAASAELVAVSSIVVYDIYKPYFNPKADEKTIVRVTHIAVCGYGIFMGVLGIIFYEVRPVPVGVTYQTDSYSRRKDWNLS